MSRVCSASYLKIKSRRAWILISGRAKQACYWENKGALALHKRYFKKIPEDRPHLWGRSACLYYSFAAQIRAQQILTDNWLAKVNLLVPVAWYLMKALVFSYRLKAKVGLKSMTADELCNHASILMRLGFYRTALFYDREALVREGMSSDTIVMILCGMAESLDYLHCRSEAADILKKASNYELLIRPSTLTRYLREMARFYVLENAQLAEQYLHLAYKIAKEHNLGDQKDKLIAFYKRYFKKWWFPT